MTKTHTIKAILALLVLCGALHALPVDIHESWVGWGGNGAQAFRSKVMIVHNNANNDRGMLVIVDDLFPRGSRKGIARVEVEYMGGIGASATLLASIKKKPYVYPMLKMYQTPLSPKMARVVLPRAAQVRAVFRFYKSLHSPMNGQVDRDYVEELTRTISVEQLEALTLVNPMRDPTVRRPRGSADGEEEPGTSAGLPPTERVAPPKEYVPKSEAEERILRGVDLETMGESPELVRARSRAKVLAAGVVAGNYVDGGTGRATADDGSGAPPEGTESAPADAATQQGQTEPAPAAEATPTSDASAPQEEESPEMKRARLKAAARLRKGVLKRNGTYVIQ